MDFIVKIGTGGQKKSHLNNYSTVAINHVSKDSVLILLRRNGEQPS